MPRKPMDIKKFIEQIENHPEYKKHWEIRALVDQYRTKLITVGMYCPDKATEEEEVSKLLESFKAGLNEVTAIISQNANAQPPEPEIFPHVADADLKLLHPEDSKKLLATLKARYEERDKYPTFKNNRAGILWSDVEFRLRRNPEILWSLNEMENTGGEPDVVDCKVIRENGFAKDFEYIFMDTSQESPEGRRNICYNFEGQEFAEEGQLFPEGNAIDMAEKMGIEILNWDQYQQLQTLDNFDQVTRNWLYTEVLSKDFSEKGHAHIGHRRAKPFNICNLAQESIYDYNPRTSFRGMIKV